MARSPNSSESSDVEAALKILQGGMDARHVSDNQHYIKSIQGRRRELGRIQYLVQWAGNWPGAETQWVDADDVADDVADDSIEEFLATRSGDEFEDESEDESDDSSEDDSSDWTPSGDESGGKTKKKGTKRVTKKVTKKATKKVAKKVTKKATKTVTKPTTNNTSKATAKIDVTAFLDIETNGPQHAVAESSEDEDGLTELEEVVDAEEVVAKSKSESEDEDDDVGEVAEGSDKDAEEPEDEEDGSQDDGEGGDKDDDEDGAGNDADGAGEDEGDTEEDADGSEISEGEQAHYATFGVTSIYTKENTAMEIDEVYGNGGQQSHLDHVDAPLFEFPVVQVDAHVDTHVDTHVVPMFDLFFSYDQGDYNMERLGKRSGKQSIRRPAEMF